MDNIEIQQALTSLADNLQQLVDASPQPVMVGIHTGGVWIAQRLHQMLDLQTPLGQLNANFFRDDFSRTGLHPSVGPSRLATEIENRDVILVDDILQTGRTVRAALNEIFDYGRPASVRLAVLIDRGDRELPVCPDYVGAHLDLPPADHVKLTGPEPLQLIKQ